MSELLIAVALFCQVHPASGTVASYVMELQQKCQKQLATCILANKKLTAHHSVLACLSELK